MRSPFSACHLLPEWFAMKLFMVDKGSLRPSRMSKELLFGLCQGTSGFQTTVLSAWLLGVMTSHERNEVIHAVRLAGVHLI